MSERPLDDALPAAQLGQAWALRVVYEELAPRVAGYLRARGASEPEDLTSEVFLTVFRLLGQVTGGATGLRTFVFTIAHARLVDDLRRRSRREPAIEFNPATHGGASASAEDEAMASIDVQAVLRRLDRLPAAQREVLVLRLVGDLSVEQVAQLLGRSAGAVKQLQRRGLIALKSDIALEGVTR